jgi:molybdopterin/thiamine biosynthesis adenylyltransferase
MALDNIDARNKVNKMCYFAKVFCIDAGTNGMQG